MKDATTVLSVVQAANTGLLLWNQVGPFLQGLLESRGSLSATTPVTDQDLRQASIELGDDISELDESIRKREAGG